MDRTRTPKCLQISPQLSILVQITWEKREKSFCLIPNRTVVSDFPKNSPGKLKNPGKITKIPRFFWFWPKITDFHWIFLFSWAVFRKIRDDSSIWNQVKAFLAFLPSDLDQNWLLWANLQALRGSSPVRFFQVHSRDRTCALSLFRRGQNSYRASNEVFRCL